MTFNTVAASMRATPEEVNAHYDRVNHEQARWARLEYKRRIALRSINSLIETFATLDDRDMKELYGLVLTLGGRYVEEINRQKDSLEIADASHYRQMLQHERSAEFWLRELPGIFKRPSAAVDVMLSLLQSAHDFFRATVNAGFRAALEREIETGK